MNSRTSSSQHFYKVDIIIPISIQRHGSTESLSHLFKVTQLGSGRTETWTQAPSPSPLSNHHKRAIQSPLSLWLWGSDEPGPHCLNKCLLQQFKMHKQHPPNRWWYCLNVGVPCWEALAQSLGTAHKSFLVGNFALFCLVSKPQLWACLAQLRSSVSLREKRR